MYAMERQQQIERLLHSDGRVAVVELARRFDVTTETVRRDLDVLERGGLLRRVHGGAVARDRGSVAEPSLAERTSQRHEAKRTIAARALSALGEGFRGSVLLDAGTTTAAIADALPAYLGATGGSAEVVTHSIPLAFQLAGAENVALTAIGGRIRSLTAAAVGADAVQAIAGMRPDVAFVGTNGLSAGFGLSTPDPDEGAVKRAIVRSARRVVVVADASKFELELLVGFAGLDEIDLLVSDEEPRGELAYRLAEAGVEVWRA